MSDTPPDSRIETFVVGSYGGPAEQGIAWYRLDTGSGAVHRVGALSGVPYPAFLARHPGGRWMYAVSETTRAGRAATGVTSGQTKQVGAVWSIRVDVDRPVCAASRATRGDLPTHLSIHPSGRWLIVSNYGSDPTAGSITVVGLADDGELGEVASLTPHTGTGSDPERQACAHVHSTLFTPSGEQLVAADLGADQLVVYGFDSASGSLDRLRTISTPPGWGPRYMAWAPDATTLLVVGELAAEVGCFAYDPVTGSLELVSRRSTLTVPRRDGVLSSDLQLSADRQLLYVANRGAVNSITTFEYEAGGALTLVGETSTHGLWPRDFAVSPDGRAMIIANQLSNDLAVIGIGADGRLTDRLSTVRHDAASFVAFLP